MDKKYARRRLLARFVGRSLCAVSVALVVAAPTVGAQSNVNSDDFAYNSPVRRGSLLTIRYRGGRTLSALAVELRDRGEQRIQSTEGFRYQDRSGKWHWIAMIGIPNTLSAGSYTAVVTAKGFLRADDARLEIAVSDRSFAREIIPLTARLTGIRTDPDPKKTEQAREYAALINSATVHAVFFSGAFIAPADSNRITSLFGDRRIYKYSDDSEGHAVHRGIDYAASAGTAVHAAASGRVRMARSQITTGNTIVIEHLPGVMTVYFHLDSLQVEENELVTQWQQIGAIGSTGLATGAHLHWELRAGGVAVDPATYLSRPLLSTIFINAMFGTCRNVTLSLCPTRLP